MCLSPTPKAQSKSDFEQYSFQEIQKQFYFTNWISVAENLAGALDTLHNFTYLYIFSWLLQYV